MQRNCMSVIWMDYDLFIHIDIGTGGEVIPVHGTATHGNAWQRMATHGNAWQRMATHGTA
jgi:hypothetical protein